MLEQTGNLTSENKAEARVTSLSSHTLSLAPGASRDVSVLSANSPTTLLVSVHPVLLVMESHFLSQKNLFVDLTEGETSICCSTNSSIASWMRRDWELNPQPWRIGTTL